MIPAALGVRAHSGWAALVAVAGSPRAPEVLVRRRVDLIMPGIPKQPFHAAEGHGLKTAEGIIQHSERTARLLARRSFRSVIADLRQRGYRVEHCGLLLSSGRPLPALSVILASHALIHTAEGELFRGALRSASRFCKLTLTGIHERELFERAAARFRMSDNKLKTLLFAIGRPLGSPWTRDEKYAALVGWLVLG